MQSRTRAPVPSIPSAPLPLSFASSVPLAGDAGFPSQPQHAPSRHVATHGEGRDKSFAANGPKPVSWEASPLRDGYRPRRAGRERIVGLLFADRPELVAGRAWVLESIVSRESPVLIGARDVE